MKENVQKKSRELKEIYDCFMEITSRYDLLDWDIQGVKIWQYSQYEVFGMVLNQLQIFDVAHDPVTKKQRFANLPFVFWNAFFKSPFRFTKKTPILLLSHPRKVLVEEQYVDIYTEYYVEEYLKHEKKDYLILEKPYRDRHYVNKNIQKTKYMDDYFVTCRVYAKLHTVTFTKEELEKIQMISSEFKKVLGCDIDLQNVFTENIKRFQAGSQYYDRLFKKTKPKAVFLVVYYTNMEFVYAAKKNNIPVIEIQHGVITPYSLSYNFPGRVKPLDYFPDKIMTFGDYWRDSAECPIPKEHMISAGYPYLEKRVEKFKEINKLPKQVLFVSQGTIGKKLFEIALDFAKKMPDYQVIYKLHPGEFHEWKTKYCVTKEYLEIKNFVVLDQNKKELYEYFAESQYVVGVYSTAIYEAIAFGCQCILADLPGIEYMEKFISIGNISLIKNATELVSEIAEKKEHVMDNKEYFFKTKSYQKAMKKVVEDCES